MASKLYFQGEDRSPVLLGCTIPFCIAAGSLVIWRIAYRFSRRTISASDYCICIALLSGIAQASFNLIAYTQYGYGRRKADIPPALLASKVPAVLFWFNMVLFKLSTGATKLSLCFVYAGLFKKADSRLVRISRILNWILAAVVVIFYTSTFIASIFQCIPIQKAWIPKAKGTCIDKTAFRYAGHSVNLITSIWVIALPLPVLFQLSNRAREITQIIFLVLLGSVHTGCVIARLVLQFFPSKDKDQSAQWTNTTGNSTSMVELFVGIIAACLVVMRPCFQGVTRMVFGTTVHGSRSRGNNSNSHALTPVSISTHKEGYITKTVDLKMTNRSTSEEDLVYGHQNRF
ncbi:hypothetical protein VTL71DRAFT_1345 [Oculimacula yallundae]|uniref:Rhodopsin domain-containing protein n=1 Tax=Oculimacula yallundae TaxID=86028 RepID=A0ABR4CBS5_9HELO